MYQDLDELTAKVKRFLLNYGVLDGDPVFNEIKAQMTCVNSKGEWEEYYMQPPFWQLVDVDTHTQNFNATDSDLDRTDYEATMEDLINRVPDSEDTVIIDIGSHYGNIGGGYLAKEKPNSKVILVSKSEPDIIKVFPKYLFWVPPGTKPDRFRLLFDRGQEIVSNEADMETRVRKLYEANGINNIRFHEHALDLKDADRAKVPEFLKQYRGKRVYIFTHRIPRDIPFMVGNLYNAMHAQEAIISPTAQGRTEPSSFSWEVIQKNMGLSDEQLTGLMLSTLDPNGGETERYQYDNAGKYEGQKRVGVMIKLGMALALAKEIDGQVYRNTELKTLGWNQMDHYIKARR
ncbi:hypothetical protein HN419_06895 [Candidatus Woesearchaeota archaeon]|jgi:hypothetical protein|nr:hypothetical protein [Candidatus Woesearchaeota archaeon]MBT3538220.1 hypothetical protein [Candidatus Woesearchaeota archaeon]MBT4696729.1 hypothetical protein [Candidatus Woesearchaeota archaeon]MBT4717237.1 hypothetical protein [Candidatus Woesearchaeota archaeon]MBT7105889.1 hypothetical protein [Candidatus Woesearchaeota archaeon]